MIEYLLNTVRPFIFSTAPPPPVIAAAQAALALLEAGPEMVQRLAINAAVLREALAAEGLSVGLSESQIVPVLVEGGFDGYLSSEYEGNRHIQDAFGVDSVEQVRRQHALFARLLGEEV